jgi:hypothetical protein
MTTFTCPCCGFDGLASRPFARLENGVLVRGFDPPYSQHFGTPSYEVCNCCGFEFGNDDQPGTGLPVSFEEYLSAWAADQHRWFSPGKKPENWSLENQLIGLRLLQPTAPN